MWITNACYLLKKKSWKDKPWKICRTFSKFRMLKLSKNEVMQDTDKYDITHFWKENYKHVQKTIRVSFFVTKLYRNQKLKNLFFPFSFLVSTTYTIVKLLGSQNTLSPFKWISHYDDILQRSYTFIIIRYFW